MPDRDDVLVATLLEELPPEMVRNVIAHLRTLGYINEITYSKLNTALSQRSRVVRSDGSETIELARNQPTPTPGSTDL